MYVSVLHATELKFGVFLFYLPLVAIREASSLFRLCTPSPVDADTGRRTDRRNCACRTDALGTLGANAE